MSYSNKLSLSIVFAFGLALPQCVKAADDFNTKFLQADAFLNSGKFKQAAGILRELIASHPDSAPAHMELGAVLASLADNNYDAAIAEEELALKLDPKSYGARKILGQIYANQNKSQESIKILTEACAISPSYSAYRDLGKAQIVAAKDEDAIASFRKAIKLNPNKIDAHIKLSGLLSKADNYKDAITEARSAIKLDLSNPESHLALGNALLASGNKADSVESFEQAMEKNHVAGRRNALTEASALSGRGWAFSGAESGQQGLHDAINDQRKAIKMFPAFGPAHIRLAELLSRQGKNKEAELIYKNSMKFSGEDAGVSTAYAKFLSRIERKDEARNLLLKVLEKSPNFKPALDALSALSQSPTTDKKLAN